MNRGLFGLLVVLLIIALVLFMASCESKSAQMMRQKTEMSVKIVLLKQTGNAIVVKQFKVKKLNDNSVYFWATKLPYEVNDTVTVKLGELQQ